MFSVFVYCKKVSCTRELTHFLFFISFQVNYGEKKVPALNKQAPL